MTPEIAALVTGAVLAAAVALGLVSRRLSGRRRAATGDVSAVGLGTGPLGERATLVQFSTEVCARCPATRRLLGAIADTRPGVAHVDVDLTHRPDLARRYSVLQTPTTFIVGATGDIRSRFGGPPSRAAVEHELDLIGALRG